MVISVTTLTMFRGRGRAGRKVNRSKVPLKGLFSDGIWQCKDSHPPFLPLPCISLLIAYGARAEADLILGNCDPRLPAQHFQTKNGGKNHGRWCTAPFHAQRREGADWLTTARGYSLHLSATPDQTMRFLPLGRRSQRARSRRSPEQLTDRTRFGSHHPQQAHQWQRS